MSKKISLVLVIALVLSLGIAAIASADGPGRNQSPTITEAALATPNLSCLVDALVKVDTELGTNLVDTFDGRRHFTVFAPVNDAFGGDSCPVVVNTPASALAPILLYHVTRGDRYATDVLASAKLRMLDGNYTYTSVNGGAYIGATGTEAMIIYPNIVASNGVVHLIDAVIVPPSP